MPLLRSNEAAAAEAVAALLDCNPFLHERVALERRALGPAFVDAGPFWTADADLNVTNPNTPRLYERTEALVNDVRRRLAAGSRASATERDAYRRMVLYLLWMRFEDELYQLIFSVDASPGARIRGYDRFAREAEELLGVLDAPLPDIAYLFATGFQARRAFHHIFRKILGSSLATAHLRADVWNSLFTDDPAAYRAHPFDHRRDTPVLITGETGTGKELVASAIGLARFVPFDAQTCSFAGAPGAAFSILNIAALGRSVLEAELFGHRRGAFTGADGEHAGWLETCPEHGALFLDEIGELDLDVQVKLLRVLQERTFNRMGETAPRRFAGKVLAATNRVLEDEIDAGRFREDLYYRICGDTIRTPSLREQLAEASGELGHLVLVVARRVVGPERAAATAAKVTTWIATNLAADYRWPGNIRELEQCVRSIDTRGSYQPRRRGGHDEAAELADLMRRGAITVKDLQRRYARLVQESTGGNLRESARRTGLSRNTLTRIARLQVRGS